MATDKDRIDEEVGLKCTCNESMQPDAYILTPCPVHGMPAPASNKNNYGSQHEVVTDAHLMSKDIEYMSGYKFKCPGCGMDSLMHYMKGCPNCLTPVIIQSDFVREIVRQMNARGRTQSQNTPNSPNN